MEQTQLRTPGDRADGRGQLLLALLQGVVQPWRDGVFRLMGRIMVWTDPIESRNLYARHSRLREGKLLVGLTRNLFETPAVETHNVCVDMQISALQGDVSAQHGLDFPNRGNTEVSGKGMLEAGSCGSKLEAFT